MLNEKWLSDEWIEEFIARFKTQFARDFNYLPEEPEDDPLEYVSDDDIIFDDDGYDDTDDDYSDDYHH